MQAAVMKRACCVRDVIVTASATNRIVKHNPSKKEENRNKKERDNWQLVLTELNHALQFRS